MLTLLEPLVASAAENLTNVIFDVVRTGSTKLVQAYGDKQIISTASKQYARKYAERHGVLRILGMREPVSLESVYTEVQFLSELERLKIISLETLEGTFRQDLKRGFPTINSAKQDGLTVAKEKQYLVVLGEPGAGKSTFLKKAGLEALKSVKDKQRSFKNRNIPVFIELKRLASDGDTIQGLIAEEFRICGFPSHAEFAEVLLKQGQLLLLLDGLDEVKPDKATDIIRQIQDFVDEYDKNFFVISCRSAAYRGSFQRFTDIIVADFSDAEIERFIDRWFKSDLDREQKTAKRFWHLLQQPEHASTKELAHRPLLLTFLCLVYDRSQNLPGKRSILYRKALDILLEEWSAEKRTYQTEIYQGFDVELEKILLSEIAYSGFCINQLFFTQEELVNQIKKFLTNTLDAPRHLNGKIILDSIVIQQGILVERAEYIYSFSHLTLQEYLVAKYISQDHHVFNESIESYLLERRWQDIFLLLAGLMTNSDELLIGMEPQARKIIDSPKLQKLINWTSQVSGSAGSISKLVIERIIIIYLASEMICGLNNSLSFEFAYGFALLNKLNPSFAKHVRSLIASNISNDIELSLRFSEYLESKKMLNGVDLKLLSAKLKALKIRELNRPRKISNKRRLFSESVCRIWSEIFKIDEETMNLTNDEMKSIEDYFYVCLLMARCKEESIRLSPKTWKTIESQILTPIRK